MIKLSSDFGFVLRKAALAECGASVAQVSALFEDPPLDEDDNLVSFGPCFGEPAATNLHDSLVALGLKYVTDFYILEFPMPDWMHVYARGTA